MKAGKLLFCMLTLVWLANSPWVFAADCISDPESCMGGGPEGLGGGGLGLDRDPGNNPPVTNDGTTRTDVIGQSNQPSLSQPQNLNVPMTPSFNVLSSVTHSLSRPNLIMKIDFKIAQGISSLQGLAFISPSGNDGGGRPNPEAVDLKPESYRGDFRKFSDFAPYLTTNTSVEKGTVTVTTEKPGGVQQTVVIHAGEGAVADWMQEPQVKHS